MKKELNFENLKEIVEEVVNDYVSSTEDAYASDIYDEEHDEDCVKDWIYETLTEGMGDDIYIAIEERVIEDFDIDNLDDWCSDNDIDIDEIINDTIYDAVY
jgi:hypothetical protein